MKWFTEVEMKKTKLYLAGPMDGMPDSEITPWRDKTKVFFEQHVHDGMVKLLDPCRRPHNLGLSHREIYLLDLQDVQACDLILADIRYFPRENTGTSCELFYCSEILKKPVIGWLTPDKKAPHIRLFMNQIVTRQFDSLDEALDHVEEYYIG
jgi:nucleoside 2-deoxyribosyltransferase